VGEHAEAMKDLGLSRGDYLRALTKEQPIEELERKAKKAHQAKCKLYTQEELDLAIARGIRLAQSLIVD
jgi:hypothetical protein